MMEAILNYACGTAWFRRIAMNPFRGLIAVLARVRSLLINSGERFFRRRSVLRAGLCPDWPCVYRAVVFGDASLLHRKSIPGGVAVSGAGPRSGPKRSLVLVRYGLTAALLLAVGWLVVLPDHAEAQTPSTLVSNLNKSATSFDYAVGPLAGFQFTQAQQFTTGSNSAGYTLTAVVLVKDNVLSHAQVSIYTNANDDSPGTSLYTLGSPNTTIGRVSFPAAGNGVALSADTKYHVVVQSSSGSFSIGGTGDNAEDSESLADWSILDYRHWRNSDAATWRTNSDKLRIKLIGHAGAPTPVSTDASLSALVLENAADNSAITLSPAFQSGTTTYSATVAAAVETITIKPTTNDDGASFKFLDDTDSEITDANMNKDGQQVSLQVGSNTIKVEVAAEDAGTTQTYTIMVTRSTDTTAPTVSTATVYGSFLEITFDEDLAAAWALSNRAFTVKKTQGNSERTVRLSGSPSIRGAATVRLRLAAPVIHTDTNVKVSYAKPSTDYGNRLEDAAGNEVASFTDQPVTNNSEPGLECVEHGYSRLSSLTVGGVGGSLVSMEPSFDSAVKYYIAWMNAGTSGVTVSTTARNSGSTRYVDVLQRKEKRVPSGPRQGEHVYVDYVKVTTVHDFGRYCYKSTYYVDAYTPKTERPDGLYANAASAYERPGAELRFFVRLSPAQSSEVTVDYATADGTAKAGSDYEATEGTLTFDAGDTGKWVTVAVLDDDHDEGLETMFLKLSNASGASVQRGTAFGFISNS